MVEPIIHKYDGNGNPKEGRPSVKYTPREQLIICMIWLAQYPTDLFLGWILDEFPSMAMQSVKRVIACLDEVFRKKFSELPSDEEIERRFQEYEKKGVFGYYFFILHSFFIIGFIDLSMFPCGVWSMDGISIKV